ncbi:MAG TPA: PAS domain-containing protein, partial [Alphaproteobacteria bacterium]|nr:PAS domain-containing protein [Alphaproteobacteria bacterium]
RSVGVSLVGVTLATLLALLAGLPVIRAPTTRLLAAAARWRQGDLSARVAVAGSPRSEFAQLGAAFNDMAEALEARDRALREAEARELGRARELSRMLVENSVQGIIAYDRHLNVLAWNPAMAALSKVPAEAAIGRPLMDVVPPLRGSESEAAMRAALAGRDHAVRDALMEVGGRRLHLESDHRPLRDGDGAVIGGIAFVRDVTLEREAEAKSRQAQRLEAVGQLTGGVAHDFNNLLQVVTGNLALALRRAEDGPLRRQLQSAAAAAERGAQLTGQLLAFARRQPLSPQSVDTPALLARLAEMLGRTLGPNYAVTARTGPGVWPVRADPGQIELALLNLALNARDAMPEGGRIELSAVNLTDAPGDLPRGEYVRIAVADDGPGMTEAVAARAFEPFFTTKPAGKGTGLGLSMVYGFSRQSGGTAVLETAPGRGLTVAMLLPRAAMAAAEPAPPPAAPTGGSGARVLVVDDDAAVREVAVALLADLGLEVAAADGGPSALDRLAAGERFDFAVFDVAMPGMNGVEAARRARALQPGLPVLFVTGHADLAVLQGVKDPVLRKPYTAEALAGAVRSLLEGRPPAIQSA